MKTPVIITALIVFSASLLQVFAQANENDYYSSDLDDAINSAKVSPTESNVVGSSWYNRSTSKSFNFPKLMNTEMSTEAVAGALDAPPASPSDAAPRRTSPLELTEREALIGKQDEADLDQFANIKKTEVGLSTAPNPKSKNLIPKVYMVDKIEFSSGTFSGTARDIRSESSSNAYLTP